MKRVLAGFVHLQVPDIRNLSHYSDSSMLQSPEEKSDRPHVRHSHDCPAA